MVTGPVSFSGLVSGLNTQSIISAEMAVYEQPLTNLQTEQSTINTQIADFQAINTQLLSLQQSADALADPSAFNEAYAAATSDSSVATAAVTSGTQTGSLTFAVDQLAVGSTQISAGTVASPNDIVTSGSVLVGSGGAALGITSMTAGTGLAAGGHTIAVTQSSSGATVAGSAPLAATTTIGPSNDQLDVVVNGAVQTVTLASGTYTPSQLAQAIDAASGGSLSATTSVSGQLSLATTEQGSAASLQVTGGSALSALSLSAGSTVNGTDGVISVDGTSTTVSDISGSGTTSVALNSGTGGTVTVGISGGLTAGSMTADSVSVGDGSLQSVVSAINGAGVGVTANALEVGTNSYALELTSNGTGTASSTTIDPQAFAGSGLGALLTTTNAQNAVVSVGGTGGYQVTSQTNALSGLLPGITINLASVSSTPVTVTVSPDGSTVAGDVQTLVERGEPVALDHFHRHRLQHPDEDGGSAQREPVADEPGPAGPRRHWRGGGEIRRRFRRDGGGVGRLGDHQSGDDHVQPDRLRGCLRQGPDRRPVDVHRRRDVRPCAARLRRSGVGGRRHRQHLARDLCGLRHPVGAAGGRRRLVDLGLRAHRPVPGRDLHGERGSRQRHLRGHRR